LKYTNEKNKEIGFTLNDYRIGEVTFEGYVFDLDTFIYDKVEFKDEETTYSTFAEGNMMHLSFLRANRQFYNTYIVNTFALQDKLPDEFIEHVKFNYIPNMSIFGGHKHELVAEASKYCLDIYYNNQEFFDKNFYNACIAEQLFIPAAMRMIQGGEVPPLFTFLFKGNPTYFKFVNESEKRDFPFEIVSENRIAYIHDETDLFKNIMNNFNGVLHLNGYKDFEKAIFLVRQRIITVLSSRYIFRFIFLNFFLPRCSLFCKSSFNKNKTHGTSASLYVHLCRITMTGLGICLVFPYGLSCLMPIIIHWLFLLLIVILIKISVSFLECLPLFHLLHLQIKYL
jgi:hypothetical protein